MFSKIVELVLMLYILPILCLTNKQIWMALLEPISPTIPKWCWYELSDFCYLSLLLYANL